MGNYLLANRACECLELLLKEPNIESLEQKNWLDDEIPFPKTQLLRDKNELIAFSTLAISTC